MEYRLIRRDGRVVWVRNEAILVGDAGGRPCFWQGVMLDITERKEVEQALRESEELHRTLIERAAESIFLVDVETRRILEANAAFYQSLGYRAEDLEELTLYDIVAHDRESVDRNIELLMEEGHRSIGERRQRRKDGSLIDVEVNASVVPHRGGEALCIVAHDVTARKLMEEDLRQNLDTMLALYEASQVLVSSPDLEENGPRLLDIMRRVADFTAATIELRDEQGEPRLLRATGPERTWRLARGTLEAREARRATMEAGRPRSFRLASHGESIGEDLPPVGLCLPLRVGDRSIGTVEAYGPESLAERKTLEVLGSLAGTVRSVLFSRGAY